ncbi:hypothetical protein [Herbaspirillum sp. alder98]|uniref:hypothetical protein n=1 Tax=Herbaspirillum sp. alder98 TaxID=2913096 RepID=UPI001CD90BB5|nr:hypothetical protein [Herbaspirillum sp. alder98]MCA1323755.1 hypothetical protein [Herbaspirillum sp. alder98]
MVIDIDDATIRHAAAVTVFGLIVCAFIGSFLSNFLMFVLDWIAERKVRRDRERQRVNQHGGSNG